MSYNNYTYIGFFFKVKDTYISTEEEVLTYKTDDGEIFKKNIKYSPNTGKKVKEIVSYIKNEELISELYDALEYYKLSPDEIDCFIDSYTQPEFCVHPKGFKFIFNNECSIYEDSIFIIDYNDINLDKFINDNLDFYNIIKDIYCSVEILYGVINYKR